MRGLIIKGVKEINEKEIKIIEGGFGVGKRNINSYPNIKYSRHRIKNYKPIDKKVD